MPDYSKSCIYKLTCLDPSITDIYVGSTTNFKARKNKHKHACNSDKIQDHKSYKYSFIRENGGWSNWIMIELEKYCCNDKKELQKRENDIMNELNATLNTNKSFITAEEKKQRISTYHKEYKIKNLQKQKQKEKEYYQNNKEAIHKKRVERRRLKKENNI